MECLPGIHKALLAPQKQVYGSKLVEARGSEASKDRLNHIRYERGGEREGEGESCHICMWFYCAVTLSLVDSSPGSRQGRHGSGNDC